MAKRVIWKPGGHAYHKPDAVWKMSRCGSVEIDSEMMQSGDVKVGSPGAAESDGMDRCDRCFDDGPV